MRDLVDKSAMSSAWRYSPERLALAALLAVAVPGCADAHDVETLGYEESLFASWNGHGPNADRRDDEPDDDEPGGAAGSGAPDFDPDDCEPIGANGTLPKQLVCTGLYEDIVDKDIASGIREFKPARELWSDGAEKTRWIRLPEDTQIDNSDPDSWIFPVGTQLFKEFRWKGHRVETRLFQKIGERRWSKATYHWAEDERSAERFEGGDVQVAGDTYYIPSPQECGQCHDGRRDNALGFETVLLGMPGAEGITLDDLVEDGLLTDAPDETELEIGDDGTGVGTEALGWLHVNCGVSCHNDNSNASGYSSDLRLRLETDELEGRPSTDYAAIRSGVGVVAQTPDWAGNVRITPGSPEDSLLFQLASRRVPEKMDEQMPPIATRVVDPDGLQVIEEWIQSMPEDFGAD